MGVKNEIKVLRDFIMEFNPFFTLEMLKSSTYDELVMIAKETAQKL